METASAGWLIEVRLFFRRTLLWCVPTAHESLKKLHEEQEDDEHPSALSEAAETTPTKKTTFHIRESQRGYRWR